MSRVFLCQACLWESWDSSAWCVRVCVFWVLWLRYRSATREREGSCLPTFVTAFACFIKTSGSERYLSLQARWIAWDMWYVITVSALSHYQSAWQYFLVSCFGKKAYALSTNVIRLLCLIHTHANRCVRNSPEKQMNICKSPVWEGEYDHFKSRRWCAYGRSMAC